MDLKQALSLIDNDDWTEETPDEWVIETYDEVHNRWTVADNGGSGWVKRESGWYIQEGDWDGYTELVAVAKAMNAADKALCASLQASRKAGE
jgi:hypothetical protein